MDLEKAKKGMRISLIVVVILISYAIRVMQPDHIRTVEALILIALGMGIGVFLVNFFQYLKLKKTP